MQRIKINLVILLLITALSLVINITTTNAQKISRDKYQMSYFLDSNEYTGEIFLTKSQNNKDTTTFYGTFSNYTKLEFSDTTLIYGDGKIIFTNWHSYYDNEKEFIFYSRLDIEIYHPDTKSTVISSIGEYDIPEVNSTEETKIATYSGRELETDDNWVEHTYKDITVFLRYKERYNITVPAGTFPTNTVTSDHFKDNRYTGIDVSRISTSGKLVQMNSFNQYHRITQSLKAMAFEVPVPSTPFYSVLPLFTISALYLIRRKIILR